MLFSGEKTHGRKSDVIYPTSKKINLGQKDEPGNHSYHICSSHSKAEQASALCILDILFFFLCFP